jgi:hypothetical protein
VDPIEVRRRQHVPLWERELEDRVVGHSRPIDQLIDDVAVDGERQDVRDRADRIDLAPRQPLQRLDLIKLLQAEQPEAFAAARIPERDDGPL